MDRSLLALVLLTVSGCGWFGRAPSDVELVEGDPFADVRGEQPGADEESAGSSADSVTPSVVPTAPGPASSLSTQPPPAAAPADEPADHGPTVVRDGIENRSTIEDDGWRLEFTVDATSRRRTDERVLLEAVLVNDGREGRHHAIDQPDLFVIADFPEMAMRRWSTQRCQSDAIDQPALGLRAVAPGERVPFTGSYVGRVDRTDCALDAGDYVVFARILVCPDDAVRVQPSGGATCSPGRERFVESGPVFLGLDEAS